MSAFSASRPDTGLFARKGEASPIQDALRPHGQPLADRRILVDPARAFASPRPAAPAAAPPLSFLIVRRRASDTSPAALPPQVPVVAQHPGFALRLLAQEPPLPPRPPSSPQRMPRHALTLRLHLDDFEAFRHTAADQHATYQSLLEPLVLAFLERTCERPHREDD